MQDFKNNLKYAKLSERERDFMFEDNVVKGECF